MSVISPPSVEISQTSKRIIHNGTEVVLGSDDDSDASLEDLDILLAPRRHSKSPSKVLPQKRRREESQQVRLDIPALVRRKQEERESKARIAEIEKKLQDKSSNNGGKSKITEESIAEFVEDGTEESKGRARKLLQVMKRTEALRVEPVWYFFSEDGPTPEKRAAFPSSCLPEEPWAAHLMQREHLSMASRWRL
jgi:hypothetical protein